jgi:hypothetical protein
MQSIFSGILEKYWGRITNQPPIGFIDPITDTGIPTGNFNMTGDYSGATKDFWIQPPTNSEFYLKRVQFQISISSTPSRTNYGSITALTNGIVAFQQVSGSEFILNPGALPIRNNTDLILFGAGIDKMDFGGVKDIYLFNIDIGDDQSEGLRLNGVNNDKFGLRLHDNFTGIDDHRMIIYGISRIVGEK